MASALLAMEKNLNALGGSGRGGGSAEFEALRRLCDLAVALTAASFAEGEEKEDSFLDAALVEAAVSARRSAACVALRFLLHP